MRFDAFSCILAAQNNTSVQPTGNEMAAAAGPRLLCEPCQLPCLCKLRSFMPPVCTHCCRVLQARHVYIFLCALLPTTCRCITNSPHVLVYEIVAESYTNLLFCHRPH